MFAKLIGAVVVTVIAATIPETRSFAVWIFLIAIIVVFVIVVSFFVIMIIDFIS